VCVCVCVCVCIIKPIGAGGLANLVHHVLDSCWRLLYITHFFSLFFIFLIHHVLDSRWRPLVPMASGVQGETFIMRHIQPTCCKKKKVYIYTQIHISTHTCTKPGAHVEWREGDIHHATPPAHVLQKKKGSSLCTEKSAP
jgi:hypothetical protein